MSEFNLNSTITLTQPENDNDNETTESITETNLIETSKKQKKHNITFDNETKNISSNNKNDTIKDIFSSNKNENIGWTENKKKGIELEFQNEKKSTNIENKKEVMFHANSKDISTKNKINKLSSDNEYLEQQDSENYRSKAVGLGAATAILIEETPDFATTSIKNTQAPASLSGLWTSPEHPRNPAGTEKTQHYEQTGSQNKRFQKRQQTPYLLYGTAIILTSAVFILTTQNHTGNHNNKTTALVQTVPYTQPKEIILKAKKTIENKTTEALTKQQINEAIEKHKNSNTLP